MVLIIGMIVLALAMVVIGAVEDYTELLITGIVIMVAVLAVLILVCFASG